MKNILVTGGAGFIGSHLCEKLFSSPKVEKVVCVDNLDPAYPVDFKLANLALLKKNKKFKFYKVDIREASSLDKIFKKEKIDAVVNVAAKTDTRTSLNEPLEYETVNIKGTLNILEASKNNNVKNIVCISSSSIYGNVKSKKPTKETEVTDFPLSPYGATKKAGEVLAYSYFYNYNISVACLRFFNVYGERMRPGPVLYTWIENIMKNQPIKISGNGQRKRDFTYISDVVNGIVKALHKNRGYNIYNIASSNPHSLKQLLSIVKKVTKIEPEVISRPTNKASIDSSYANISKAKKMLGWKPIVGLEEGVLKFFTWYQLNRLK